MSQHRRPDDRDRRFGARRDRPPGRGGREERPERGERPERRPWSPRPPGRAGRPPADEGAMSVRLDPRRRDQLKRLSAAAGMRPGELVVSWVIERLDAESGAARAPSPRTGADLAALGERLSRLERRVAQLAQPPAAEDRSPSSEPASPAAMTEPGVPEPSAGEAAAADESLPPRRVALHDEIAAVLEERGPLSAAEIAAAVTERERYRPPRSGRAIDAGTINSRVSNPHYRERFTRSDGRISLAE